jgi:hypothetical protein
VATLARLALVRLPARIWSQRAEAEVAVPWYPARIVRLAAHWSVATLARPALVLLPVPTSSQQAAARLRRAECPPEAEVAVPLCPARVVRLAAHWSAATLARLAWVLLPVPTSSQQAAARLRRAADCPPEAEVAVPLCPARVVRLAAHWSAATLARLAWVLLPAQTSSQQAAARPRRAGCPPEAEVAVPWYPARIVRLAAHSPAATVARPGLDRLPARIWSQEAAVRLRRADCPPEPDRVARSSPVRLDPLAERYFAAQGMPGTALASAVAAFLWPVGPAADWE